MLHTKLGDIYIAINNNEAQCEIVELDKKGEHFEVDRRYKVLVDTSFITDELLNIDCILKDAKNSSMESRPETGEDLALISFYWDNIKLSIGTIGDIAGIEYEYLADRIRLKISKEINIKEVIFYIAWITMKDIDKEDIYTWFAADPTL